MPSQTPSNNNMVTDYNNLKHKALERPQSGKRYHPVIGKLLSNNTDKQETIKGALDLEVIEQVGKMKQQELREQQMKMIDDMIRQELSDYNKLETENPENTDRLETESMIK